MPYAFFISARHISYDFSVVVESKHKRTSISAVVITYGTSGEEYNIECIFYSNIHTEMKVGPRRGEGIAQRNRKRTHFRSYPGFVLCLSVDVNNPLILLCGVIEFPYDSNHRRAECRVLSLVELCALCCELRANGVNLCCK